MRYPKTKNINIVKYSDYNEFISLFNDNHLPRNLTGYIAVGQLKRFYSSTTAIKIFCNIDIPSAGLINISLPASVTSTLESSGNVQNTYVYDIVIRNTTTGVVERVREGLAYISEGVTNLLDSNTIIVVDPVPTNISLSQ